MKKIVQTNQEIFNHKIICSPIFTYWKIALDDFDKFIELSEKSDCYIFYLPIEHKLYNFWSEMVYLETYHIENFLNKVNLLNNSLLCEEDVYSKQEEYRLNYLETTIYHLVRGQLSHLKIDLEDDDYKYMNSDVLMDLYLALRIHYFNKSCIFDRDNLIREVKKIALFISNISNTELFFKLLRKVENNNISIN